VLPSPSGAASGHWTLEPWHDLAEWIGKLQENDLNTG
jgi:TDG/mug DNA glycosylase family protein